MSNTNPTPFEGFEGTPGGRPPQPPNAQMAYATTPNRQVLIPFVQQLDGSITPAPGYGMHPAVWNNTPMTGQISYGSNMFAGTQFHTPQTYMTEQVSYPRIAQPDFNAHTPPAHSTAYGENPYRMSRIDEENSIMIGSPEAHPSPTPRPTEPRRPAEPTEPIVDLTTERGKVNNNLLVTLRAAKKWANMRSRHETEYDPEVVALTTFLYQHVIGPPPTAKAPTSTIDLELRETVRKQGELLELISRKLSTRVKQIRDPPNPPRRRTNLQRP